MVKTMSNPLFDMLGSQLPEPLQIMQQFNQFRQSFHGNPQEEVQHLLNSGKISQQQYNEAVRKAQMLQSFLNR